MFEKNAAKAAALQKVLDHVTSLPPDTKVLTFVEVEQATGVPMRAEPIDGIDGRALLRKALAEVGWEHVSIRATGVTLSQAENASDIAATRRKKAVSGLRRAGRSIENLSRRHLGEMTPAQRESFTRETSLMSTLAMLAGGGQGMTKKALKP